MRPDKYVFFGHIVLALGIGFLFVLIMLCCLLQLILQSHANDDQRLALTGVPLLPVHEHCFVSSLGIF